jgi:hypothetical protein
MAAEAMATTKGDRGNRAMAVASRVRRRVHGRVRPDPDRGRGGISGGAHPLIVGAPAPSAPMVSMLGPTTFYFLFYFLILVY